MNTEKLNNNSLEQIENLLLAQKSILNIEELSQLTGLSKSFIYKLTAQRRIPFSKPCKIIFFKKEDVEKWLMSNPISPLDDIEQEAINYLSQKSLKGGLSWS